ncbi:MAG: formyltransferase family protein, partial [Actinomycetota bacterium]|nr:formyltransferase family protein [Actinomycetota bacterium]
LGASIVGVFSNRADAFGLDRARRAGIPVAVVATEGDDRPTYDRRLADVVAKSDPDLVVLAGWMRILTAEFLGHFRVVNLHPAKPGLFPGTHAIERAFAAWVAGEIDESGAMVHWVPDEGVDSGPVIQWTTVPFEPADTLEAFEARMHAAEYRLLVSAVGSVLDSDPDSGPPGVDDPPSLSTTISPRRPVSHD